MAIDFSGDAKNLLLKLSQGGKLFRLWWENRPWFELDGQPLDPLAGPQELMRKGLIENKPLTDQVYGHRIPISLTSAGEDVARTLCKD